MPDLVEVGTGGVFRAFRRRRHACSHGACDAPFGALRPAILVAVGCVNGAVSAPSGGNWGESSRADAWAFERAQSLTAFRAFSIVRGTRKSPPVHTLISAAGAFFRPVGAFGRRRFLRGALNTRMTGGGAALAHAARRERGSLPQISHSGVRSGRADSPERQTSEFQLQRQRHRAVWTGCRVHPLPLRKPSRRGRHERRTGCDAPPHAFVFRFRTSLP